MENTQIDWLDVCLPLAETVQDEQYTPNTEELLEFFED
jgi:hypothetical protein